MQAALTRDWKLSSLRKRHNPKKPQLQSAMERLLAECYEIPEWLKSLERRNSGVVILVGL